MSRKNRNRQGNSGGRRGDSSGQDQQKQSGDSGDRKQQQSGRSGGGGKKGRGRGGRSPKANMVVLVDIDQDYVEMESKAVVNYVSGYNPMGFTDTGRAINYLSNPRNKGRIGLVILNVDLTGQPEGRGVKELIDILSSDEAALLAVVCETNTPEKLDSAREIGANGILPKPFTVERFVRFVKGVLRTGESTAWQCETCGKVVVVDQIDMLKMQPIKCSDRECGSNDLKQIDFPAG